jgi:hypothetical protein
MIASLALDLFNSGLFDCWIAPFPQGCVESWRSPDGQTTCVRGNNASLYQWVFDVIPKWLGVLLVTVNMFLTHRSVYVQEKKTQKYTNPEVSIRQWSLMPAQASDSSWRMSERESSRDLHPVPVKPSPVEPDAQGSKRNGVAVSAGNRHLLKLPISRRLANQSYLYVGALYLTYIPVIVTRSFELVHGYVYYEMLLTISIMIPFQGFWNGKLVPGRSVSFDSHPLFFLQLPHVKFLFIFALATFANESFDRRPGSFRSRDGYSISNNKNNRSMTMRM